MKEAAMAEEADGAEDSEGRLRSTCEGAEDHGQPRQVVSTGFFFLFLWMKQEICSEVCGR